MASPIEISAVLVSYNTEGLLRQCINALRAALAPFTHEIIIVDNASRDGSVALIKAAFSDCRLVENSLNVGFGRANNQALEWVRGRYVLLLNTDAFVPPDAVTKSVAYLENHPQCGLLGGKLVGRDGSLQPSARYFPTPLNIFLQKTGLNQIFRQVRLIDDLSWDHASVRDCDWVPGCYCVIRREVIDQVGLFDARYFLYYEEVDLCFAAKKAGWQVTYLPDATVVHIGGESAKSVGDITAAGRQLDAMQIESELLYFRKNYGVLIASADVMLTVLAEAVLVLKRALKGKTPLGVAAALQRSGLVLSLFQRTGWAARPTR